MVKSKCSWRWQMRSKPCVNGGDAASPADALSLFLRSNAEKLAPETCTMLQRYVADLRALDPDFRAWMLSVQPPQPLHVLPQNGAHRGLHHTPPCELSWDTVLDVQRADIPTLRHVPQSCLTAFVSLVHSMLATIPSLTPEPALCELVHILPKLILPAFASSDPLLRAYQQHLELDRLPLWRGLL